MNLISFLEQHNIPYRQSGQHHHAGRGWVQIDCPWCSPGGQRFRLGIHSEHLITNCWTCGGHSLVEALWYAGDKQISYREASQAARSLSEAQTPRLKADQLLGRLKIPSGLSALSQPHRRYLEGRGFDPDEIARLWGVMGIGTHPRCGWSLWIPVRSQGETVSWTTRSVSHQVISRYLSARPDEESQPMRSVLYGGDYVRHSTIVCEGPTDVWRIGPGATATMGTVFSQEQVALLSEIPLRTICFDQGRAAQKRAGRLANALSMFPGETRVVEIETGGDVAEADSDEVDELRKRYL